MCDRFPCITRSIIPAPTDPIQSRLHLVIINLTVKILNNSNNLFGNPWYWTIFLLRKCILALIKVERHGSKSIHFCPLRHIKVGSFCFSAPVRRSGCGGLLVSTDCVRWRWCWSALLCVTAAVAVFFSSTFSRHCPENTWRISLKNQFFTLFFCWEPSVKSLRSHGGVGWELPKIIIDFYSVICLVRWIMVRIGKVGREVVTRAWLSLIIKMKLTWLSRSIILPLGTFPWLSLSVIHTKTSLNGSILMILSTYQAW